jgi:hypothetical protein
VVPLSGYALEGEEDLRDVAGGLRVLQKPFSVDSLGEAVRRALALPSGAPESPVVTQDRWPTAGARTPGCCPAGSHADSFTSRPGKQSGEGAPRIRRTAREDVS